LDVRTGGSPARAANEAVHPTRLLFICSLTGSSPFFRGCVSALQMASQAGSKLSSMAQSFMRDLQGGY
jgi:hypothetical protein